MTGQYLVNIRRYFVHAHHKGPRPGTCCDNAAFKEGPRKSSASKQVKKSSKSQSVVVRLVDVWNGYLPAQNCIKVIFSCDFGPS